MNSKPLLGLVMIVKDEVHCMKALAQSVIPYIDYWTILDTGSTDGTQEVIHEAFAGTPGKLYTSPFIDYATSRNQALDLAAPHTEFVLMMDGEQTLKEGKKLRQFCQAAVQETMPAYFVYIKDIKYGRNWWNPFLIRTSSACRYKGAVHEHLEGVDVQVRVPYCYIEHAATAKGDERTEQRLFDDRQILEKELKDAPSDYRLMFYLAQTCACLGDNQKAYELYSRCLHASLGPIAYQAAFRRAVAAEKLFPFKEVIQHYFQAFSYGPHRAEPLYIIAKLYMQKGEYQTAFPFALRAARLPMPADTMGVNERVYESLVFELLSTICWEIKEYEIGEQAAKKALEKRPKNKSLIHLLRCYEIRKPNN